jgi:hypothetical protein
MNKSSIMRWVEYIVCMEHAINAHNFIFEELGQLKDAFGKYN